MSVGANSFTTTEPHGHVVQLYGEDKRLLTEHVGQYLRTGLRRGDGLVVVELFCAYPIDILAEPYGDAMHALVCAHTHLMSGDGNHLAQALDRALEEELGVTSEGLAAGGLPAVYADSDRRRPVMPKAEAAILWLKAHCPEYADRVLARVRQYRLAPPATA